MIANREKSNVALLLKRKEETNRGAKKRERERERKEPSYLAIAGRGE
jgi:hypothetical protein